MTNNGEPILYHEELLSLKPMFLPKSFDVPYEGEYSGGLDAYRFVFKPLFGRQKGSISCDDLFCVLGVQVLYTVSLRIPI